MLDARTGKPITHNTVSITVIHDNSTQVNIRSTALLCLGVNDDQTFARQHNIAVLFIPDDGNQLLETPIVAWLTLKENKVEVN